MVDCVLCRGEMTTCCFKSLFKSGSACLRVVFLLFTSSADCANGSEATLEELQSRGRDFRAKAK